MDSRSALPSSSRNGGRYFDVYAASKEEGRPGIVKPSFASSSSSHLPASLGIGSSGSQGATGGLGGRPGPLPNDRRVHSESRIETVGSMSQDTGSSAAMMRFASGSHRGPDRASSSFLAPNWMESSKVVRRSPIPGLPAGAQLLESTTPQSSARNFLVPIGSTGARQKLSIANASQRRKLGTSDEVRWPAQLPDDPYRAKRTLPDAVKGQLNWQDRGANASGGQYPILPRSRSDGLVQAWTSSESQTPAHESPGRGVLSGGSTSLTGSVPPDAGHFRLATSHSSSSLTSSGPTGVSKGATSRVNGKVVDDLRPSSASSSLFGTKTTETFLTANRSSSPLDRPPIPPRGVDPYNDADSIPRIQHGVERPRNPSEFRQDVKKGPHDKQADGLEAMLGATIPVDSRYASSGPVSPTSQQLRPEASGLISHTTSATPSRSHVTSQAQGSQASQTQLIHLGGPSVGVRGTEKDSCAIRGAFAKDGRPTDVSLESEALRSEVRHLTTAELYKQSMLERDLARSDPGRVQTPSKDTAGAVRRQETGAGQRSAAPSVPPTSKAPLLDFNFPDTSFFDLGEGGGLVESRPSSSRHGRHSSATEEEGRKDSNTEESDKSIGSFEGAYVHPALESHDSPLTPQKRIPGETVAGHGGVSSMMTGPRYEGQLGLMPAAEVEPVGSKEVAAINDGKAASGAQIAPSSDVEEPSSSQVTPRLSASESFGPTPSLRQSPSTQDSVVALDLSRSTSHGTDLSDDPLATPTRSRLTYSSGTPKGAPTKPSRSKDRAPPLDPLSSPKQVPDAFQEVRQGGASSGPPVDATADLDSARCEGRGLFSTDPSTFITTRQGSLGSAQSRGPAESLAEESDSSLVGAASLVQWQRAAEAYNTLSPEMRQSRFSEASTDASDSRTTTRNGHRLSALDTSDIADDGEAIEDESSMDGQMLPTSAWVEVENALRKFRDRNPATAADRGNLLRTVLLPFLALEAETASVDVVGPGPYVQGKARRALFFDWIRFLLLELQHVQTSADRGAILESIACIIESRNFSVGVLSQDAEDEARFSSVFGHILSYAVGELNKKGVYQNTLIFSGRLLAVAFFRVVGVATKLLRALPVNRFALERVAKEADWERNKPPDLDKFRSKFPASLQQLCFKDARTYLKMLDNESASASTEIGAEDDRFLVRQPEVEVEMTGNWLRRWQSDDSELFFSFCRSYHRQLACLLASSKQLDSVTRYFFGGPGYAHLATCVHQKCLALVHRVILSVTTLSSQKNFNPAGETANVLLGSTAGKPRVLEAANRRCTAIVVDIVRAPSGGNMIFAPMLGLHIKCLVKRTSLYDVQGVFCLLDWLDGVLGHMDQADLINEGLIDISFVITTIGLLLEDADHALALMRTIAFCYANFGVLTATKDSRTRFCEEILLKPKVFNKLFLSWSFTIRAYFLHLLVFRLARINDFPHPPDDPQGKTAVNIARLFNQRLEAIRKRHDQLSPLTDSSSDGDKSEADDRSKRRTASSFVSTIKKTPSITGVEPAATKTKAERLLGISGTEAGSGRKSDEKPQSKAKNWLRALRGSKSSKSSAGSNGSDAGTAQGRTRMTPVDEATDADEYVSSAISPTLMSSSPRASDSDSLSDASTLDGGIGLFSSGGPAKLAPFEFEISSKEEKESDGLAHHIATMPIGHDAGIASDATFDLQNATPPPPTPGALTKRASLHSPRVSKAFSRRSSMLPGPASELAGLNELELPPLPEVPLLYAQAYDESLHIYAVQSLREYEQTVQEHDEFFASLPKDQGAQVPRLPVNWPAMWSSTGE